MFFKKSQVALEYMVVLAIVLTIVLAIYFVVYDRIYDEDDIIEFRQAQDAAREIVSAAEEVYYRGPPSKSTFRLQLPDSIEMVSAEDAGLGYYVLMIRINPATGPKVISYPTKVPLKIDFPDVSVRNRFDYVSVQAKRTGPEDVFVEVCGPGCTE